MVGMWVGDGGGKGGGGVFLSSPSFTSNHGNDIQCQGRWLIGDEKVVLKELVQAKEVRFWRGGGQTEQNSVEMRARRIIFKIRKKQPRNPPFVSNFHVRF